jgi:RNA 2',3'-cyclic 3'-phosphodiesterase
MSLRLFAALSVPDDIADRLIPLQRDVGGAAWRPRAAFHLTLRFFGEITEPLAHDLDHELGRIREGPFEMRLRSVGSFGGREPSALWAGVEAPAVLGRLATACERAARRVGLKADTRKFAPHVTLAYLGQTTDVEVARYQTRFADFRTDLFWVDRFALYSSHQTKGPNAYIEEAVYPLDGAPHR